ncbi:MAG: NDP-sugar synthase [Limisphaerales bacterium]
MKAMVLCAGYGTRLGDLTREIPKPMLPVAGRPLLAYLLGHLRAHGFNEIAINLHFQPQLIRDTFGDGSRWNLRLHYSDEPSLLGTAGGVKRVEEFFRDQPSFLIQYGDILTDHDLGALVRFHQQRQALATLLVHPRPNSNSAVSLDPDGRVIGFLERPSEEHRARAGITTPWVNSGICVASPELLDHIPAGIPADLPRDVFIPLVTTGRLFAMPLSGFRCAIDSPDRLAEARAGLAENRCHITALDTSTPTLAP